MIYDSLDIIPAKLYERIEATGNVRLLTDDPNVHTSDLMEIWSAMEDADLKISSSKDAGKVLDIGKRLESISAKLEFVKISTHVLKNVMDDDLIHELKEYGYKFTFESISNKRNARRQYLRDIEKIEKQSSTLAVKIGRLNEKLPKPEKTNSSEVVTFDESILGYGVLCGAGFIDTNAITRTQYHALIKTGNKKMRTLSGSTGKSSKKSRYGNR